MNDKYKDQVKETQKKKDNDQSAKRYCMRCKKEIFPAFNCACSGGGGPSSGGEGGGGSSSEEKSDMKSAAPSSTSDGMVEKQTSKNEVNVKSWDGTIKPALTPKETMMLIISDLLSKKLLTIDDNKGLCTLTIKCDPKLLSESQRNAVKEFVKVLQKELDEFRNKNGISDKDCLVKIEKDKQGNIISLSINFPLNKKTLYDAFINHLKNQKLMPISSINQEKKDTVSEHKRPSPFSDINEGPKPKGWEKT